MKTQKKGKLYLIPVALGDNRTIDKVIPDGVVEITRHLRYFIVEKIRTARRFIASCKPLHPIDEITFFELDKHSVRQNTGAMLRPLLEGNDMGLMSEAGTPAVADPGSEVVAKAHEAGIEVVPLAGPNSLILALMASGFNGQGFVFHGYLPIEEGSKIKKLKEIENAAYRNNQTQIFIETPYRNMRMLETVIKTCRPQTKLCIACDLTLPSQWIKTQTVEMWKKETANLHKRPAVFLLFR